MRAVTPKCHPSAAKCTFYASIIKQSVGCNPWFIKSLSYSSMVVCCFTRSLRLQSPECLAFHANVFQYSMSLAISSPPRVKPMKRRHSTFDGGQLSQIQFAFTKSNDDRIASLNSHSTLPDYALQNCETTFQLLQQNNE